MANTWNKAGTTWGYNSWESDTVTQSLTAPSTLTSSLGDIISQANKGWGYQAWGSNEWGELNDNTASLTGLSATASLGEVQAYSEVRRSRDHLAPPWCIVA